MIQDFMCFSPGVSGALRAGGFAYAGRLSSRCWRASVPASSRNPCLHLNPDPDHNHFRFPLSDNDRDEDQDYYKQRDYDPDDDDDKGTGQPLSSAARQFLPREGKSFDDVIEKNL